MVQHRHIRFHRDKPANVLAVMRDMADRKDGSTWINIEPDVEDDVAGALTDRSGVAGWFSGRGSDLPVATFMAVDMSGRRPVPATVGIQHATGPKAIERLGEHGIVLPEGCVTEQDSAKRGLVVAVPERIPVADVLGFLIPALTVFLRLPHDGWFRADIASTE